MKTLKELKKECILIAELKNPNFIGEKTNDCYNYIRANKCALYTDNKGKFYLFKYIDEQIIKEYDSYEMAIERFMSLIDVLLER